MTKITIITLPDCSRCQDAKTIINKLKPKYDLTVEEIDSKSDKGLELIKQYKISSIPGILINNKFFSMGAVTENQLRDEFEKLKKGSGCS